jgi:predicted enzyme related to lactoylglutathione lyase
MRYHMNTVQYFEIQSSDPEVAISFYSAVFGRTFFRDENLPIPYWRIHTNWINGWLYKRPAATPPLECWANAFVNSMQVEDFDTIAEKILISWWKVAMPKFAIPGFCYQGYFLDPDNNVFGLFEQNEKAGL